jgi:hypothetical protein
MDLMHAARMNEMTEVIEGALVALSVADLAQAKVWLAGHVARLERVLAAAPQAAAPVEPSLPVKPVMVRINARSRDLNGKGNGQEEHRRLRMPHLNATIWAADGQDVRGNWVPRGGTFAASRRCSQTVLVPVGTIVVAFDRSFRAYERTGSAEVKAGVVSDRPIEAGKSVIDWTLSTRRTSGKVEVQFPSGEWVEA